jgi:hypothetical protein
VGEEIDGIGRVERDSTLDGKPILECVHALIVFRAMLDERKLRGRSEIGNVVETRVVTTVQAYLR